MKRIVTVIFVSCMAIIAGCATLKADVAKIEDHIATKVNAVTIPDLENAKLGANKLPEPSRTDFLTCFNEHEDYLVSVKAATEAAVAASASDAPPSTTFNPLVFGAATAAVDAQNLVADLQSDPLKAILASIPPVPHQLMKDCFIVYGDSKVALLKIGLDAGSLAASVANIAAAAKLKAAGGALKAAEAALGKP